jgi:hypothetical protein
MPGEGLVEGLKASMAVAKQLKFTLGATYNPWRVQG